MKQKDLALILVIVFIAAISSLFVSKAIFATPKSRSQQVVVAPTVTSQFQQPSPAYFNSSSFDPTVKITIGKTTNNTPF